MPEPTCYQHPDVPASLRCGGCLKPLCAGCAVFEGGKDRCPPCVTRYWRAKKVRTVVSAALAVTAFAGGLAWHLLKPAESPSEVSADTGPGAFDYGPKAALIASLREGLEREPCNRSKAMEYVQALLTAKDFRGTIDNADGFIAKCGKYAQLRHVTYSAHTRLSEHDNAIRDATELIDSNPDNATYWIWRGTAHEALGNQERAVEDLRQAFRIQPDQRHVANHLANAYERLLKPCDALTTLLEHLHANAAHAQDSGLMARLGRLAETGGCQVEGRGRAVLSFQGGMMLVEALVNGKHHGRFVVDTGASLVTLSRSFADKLGLKLENAPTIRVYTANGVTQAHLSLVRSISVRDARADNVEVAVADKLPESLDGLLGLSYLGRFEMKLDAKLGRLELSERKPQTKAADAKP